MNTVLIVLTTISVFSLILFMIVEYGLKKWKCTEGQCEKMLGGDYSSKEECENHCKESTKDVLNTPRNGYDCVNNQCVGSEDGRYNTINDCLTNCGTYSYYPYYYPLSYYYGGGRRHHRRNRHHHRHHHRHRR